MTGGIFDRSVLIDCLRGRANAIAFLATQSTLKPPRTHLFVAAELLTGARDKGEQILIDSFLQAFDLAVPTEADGLAALDLYRQFRLSHGVDWPDCQIAATSAYARGSLYAKCEILHCLSRPPRRQDLLTQISNLCWPRPARSGTVRTATLP